MMAGMAYELEARWHRDDGVAEARDSMHHRAAMESREARRAGAEGASRPGLLDRLIATFKATTRVRPAAR
jgi:hypothetical protein